MSTTIHPTHRAALEALSMTPLADLRELPSSKPAFFVDFQSLPLPSSLPYSFDDSSSPQTTPTADIADPFLAQWERVAARQRQTSSASLADSDTSVSTCASFSDISDSSSFSSPSSSFENLALSKPMSRPSPTPLQRSSSCRYATTESAPAMLTVLGISKDMGGASMVRSYSTPIASFAELRKAKEWAAAQSEELARTPANAYRKAPSTTDSISFPLSSRPSTVASDLHNFPTNMSRSPSPAPSLSSSPGRPALGRFQSFEPALMATSFGRERY